jgi:hypothetical protein
MAAAAAVLGYAAQADARKWPSSPMAMRAPSRCDVAARAELGRLDIRPTRLKEAQSAPNYARTAKFPGRAHDLRLARLPGDVTAFGIASRKQL